MAPASSMPAIDVGRTEPAAHSRLLVWHNLGLAHISAVHSSAGHTFSKSPVPELELVAGIGVRGDAHAGAQVKHRSRVKADPTQPNLRQVHLIHSELLATVAEHGFEVSPGDLGENLTTSGLDLLGLPLGTVLRIGDEALVAVTGLRNPCVQIDRFQDGLLRHMVDRSADGTVHRLAGIMGVVVGGGVIRPMDEIQISMPPGPHKPLERV